MIIDGSKIEGTLSEFPILVTLPAHESIKNNARSDGLDIIFVNGQTFNILSYVTTEYSSATGELMAWVNIPSLTAANDGVFYIYYGNPVYATAPNAYMIWDNEYRAIWHLDETADDESSITDLHRDATLGSNHGSQHGNHSTTGIIGNAQYFDGTTDAVTDYINVGNFDPSTTELTISLWVNWKGENSRHQVMVAKRDEWSDAGMRWQFVRNTTKTIMFQDPVSNGGGKVNFGADIPSSNTWHYLVITKLNGLCTLYIDGVQQPTTDTMSMGNGTTADVLIGGIKDGVESFYGSIDELRISSTIRSEGWIKTSYNNQSSPDTFILTGPVETQ